MSSTDTPPELLEFPILKSRNVRENWPFPRKKAIAETLTYFSTLLTAVYPCYHLITNHLRYTIDVKRWFRKGVLTGSSGYPGRV